MKDFYEVPTMVKFLDPNYFEDGANYECREDGEEYWLGGIAYEENIICGCCGGTFAIDELKEDYGEERLRFEELEWINIVNEIIGE